MLRNATVLDPEAGELTEGRAVVVEDGRVVAVDATTAVRAGEATVLDARGMTAMPGLIDAHVHVNAATATAGGRDGRHSTSTPAARPSP